MALIRCILFLVCLLVINVLQAQSINPDKPITIVVPYPAGGTIDRLARIIAPELGAQLFNSVIVENRPGGNGSIGVEHVIHSKPDGKTILLTNSPLNANQMLFDEKQEFQDKLQPVIQLTNNKFILVVNSDTNVKSIFELKQYAKTRKGGINCAGVATYSYLLCHSLDRAIGNVVVVPYKGIAPATIAVMSGEVDVFFMEAGNLQVIEGVSRVRAIAISSAKDLKLPYRALPLLSQWSPRFKLIDPYYAVFVPNGTSTEMILMLNQAFNSVLSKPSIGKRLRENDITIAGGSVQVLEDSMAREAATIERDYPELKRPGRLSR